MELFQSNALLISKVKTFKEVHLEYLAVESNVFQFGMNDALLRLRGRSGADSSYTAGKEVLLI